MIKLRTLLIGCVESSRILLQKLISMGEEIFGVITKKQSNFYLDFYDLSGIFIKNNIDHKFVNNLSDIDSVEYLSNKKPDFISISDYLEKIIEIMKIYEGELRRSSFS